MSANWAELFPAFLPLLVICSGRDNCILPKSSFQSESPVLKSLQCHNDYQSYVDCHWREDPAADALELWNWNSDGRQSLCEPYGEPSPGPDGRRTVQCRFRTSLFAIAINHTFFFKTAAATPCPSAPGQPLELSVLLRLHPPVNLSTHASERGARLLTWSGPYPASSSLSRNLSYQLSYRREGQDVWSKVTLGHTRLRLEAESMTPGFVYQAKVRARGPGRGPWSEWSPLVTWKTDQAPGQAPVLRCVLDREMELTCSWEVKRDLAHFITYQLACRYGHATPLEWCCANPAVIQGPGDAVLTYSCSLTVPEPARLLLELVPARSVKMFQPHRHIRPNPPVQVEVAQTEHDWLVTWHKPESYVRLSYQVSYWNAHNQSERHLFSVEEGSVSLRIPGSSLSPSQLYLVQVRSLVVPGDESQYEGTPSRWTQHVRWTSNPEPWSYKTLLYIAIGVLASLVFLGLCRAEPAVQRRMAAWKRSIPSPDKSNVLSEMKNPAKRPLMQTEMTYICEVENSMGFSSCPSKAPVWLSKSIERRFVSVDDGCWDCSSPLSLDEQVSRSETFAPQLISPYIVQGFSAPSPQSVDVQREDNNREDPTLGPSSQGCFNLSVAGSRVGYVFLPNLKPSRSAEELAPRHVEREADDRDPNGTFSTSEPEPQPRPSIPPSAIVYTSLHFSASPQEGDLQPSGYCSLPVNGESS